MKGLTLNNGINQLLFQVCYFACILGAANGHLWPGFVALGLLGLWQLAPSRRHPADIPVVFLALFVGAIVDSTWVISGLAAYSLAWPSSELAPAWILFLWMAFALTINHSLGFFSGRPWLTAVFFGLGSPLSFYFGSRVGAVQWLAPEVVVIVVLGLSWAMLIPALYAFSRFWTGFSNTQTLPEAAAAGVIDESID